MEAWQSEIAQLFRGEISIHFAAEEQVLFPAARKFVDLVPLLEELLADHAWLRENVAKAEAGRMSAADLSAFGRRFSAHIRKEERQLFEQLQGLMRPDELGTVGKRLDEALKDTDAACTLPTQATRLRPKN